MSQAQANKKVSVLISYSHSYDAMDKLCRPFKYYVTHPALPSRKKNNIYASWKIETLIYYSN